MGLIALIATIAIIAILAAIMYPKMAGKSEYDAAGDQVGTPTAIDEADDSVCITYQSQVADAVTMYKQDHNGNPQSLDDLRKYGVTKEIAETPNCNFQLPLHTPQPVATQAAPVSTPVRNLIVNYSGSQIQSVQPQPQVQQQPMPQQQPAGGNNILPTKMGRSIPLDGGSANINAQAGDTNGSQ
jgi:hypothetical protein